MTYHKKLSAVLKVGGKVLREVDNQVTIPFGSEYSIFIKNLDSVKCQVRISIDGSNVTSERWIIVQPNSSVEIERSINNHNLNAGNKFKFIERTDAIENNRGIKAEDGLIRIEYQFEKRFPKQVPEYYYYPVITKQPWDQNWLGQNIGGINTTATINVNNNSDNMFIGATYTASVNTADPTKNINAINNISNGILRSAVMRDITTPFSDAGITVPGSESSQKFTDGGWFVTESETHVIVLSIKGNLNNKPVEQPITVDIKPKCVTCGRINKFSNKFCSQCGTSLNII